MIEVLKGSLEDLSKELTEYWREPLVERGILEGVAKGIDLLLTELLDGSVVAGKKADR